MKNKYKKHANARRILFDDYYYNNNNNNNNNKFNFLTHVDQ